LYNCQEPEGKWGSGYKMWESYLTAWAVYAYLRCGILLTSKLIMKSWLWLTTKQNKDGSYKENNQGYKSNTCCTAYVLRTMALLKNSLDDQKEQGLNWLINCQNKDGGFGIYPGDKSNPLITATVLNGIIDLNNHFKGNLGQKGLGYLTSSQSDNGYWIGFNEQSNNINETASVLYLLTKANIRGVPIQKAFNYLELKTQMEKWRSLPLADIINLALAFKARS